ncbi:MAG: serine hydrolase domain-containing protein [Ferruginibacter sp.]
MIPARKKININNNIPGSGSSLSRFLVAGVVVIFLFSCKSGSGAKDKEAVKDSIAILKLPAPKPVPGPELARIKHGCEQWYDSILKPGNFNGGILVAKNGNIVFERYNGTGHLGHTDTITATTPIHIASVSKTFTAMAVLKLAQDGKLQLDDEFNKYFPTFNYPGVTIRNLLSHRSGLPNYLYFMDELGWDKTISIRNQDVLDQLINRKAELKDISSPGTHFTYCNTNYALLALLIEKISGISYPQFLKKVFFIPLQMTNSFVFTPEDSARINPSYDWRGTLIPINALDQVYGDKNIYTTPRDLLKWDRALATALIFKPEIMEQAYAPYSNERPGIRNYGLGWRMNIYPDGKKLIYHNGWWHGNNAAFIRIIDEDATIIVMGNRFTRGVYKAKNLVAIFNPDLVTESEEETESSKLSDSVQVIGNKSIPIKKRQQRTGRPK